MSARFDFRAWATSMVVERDEPDDTVSVYVADRRVAKGLACGEAEELALDLRGLLEAELRDGVAEFARTLPEAARCPVCRGEGRVAVTGVREGKIVTVARRRCRRCAGAGIAPRAEAQS